MIRAALVSLCVAVVFAFGAAPASAATTCTWNGASADWQTIGDWSCGAVPTSADDVVINSGTPDVATTNANARSITVGASGSLVVATGFSLTTSANGSSSFANSVTVNGTLTMGDATTWTGGTVGGGGVFHIGAGGSLTTNPGSSGNITFVPQLDADGPVTVQTGTLQLNAGDAGTTTGSYTIDSGATLKLLSGTFDSPSVTGAGTVDIVGLTVTVGAADTFSPATLQLESFGTLTLNNSASITNLVSLGGIRDGTGTLSVTGTATFSASMQFNGGTTTIANTVPSVAFSAGALSVSNATLNLNAPATWSGNQWTLQNHATLNVNSSLSIPNLSGALGGDNTSVLHVGSTGSVTFNPGAGKTLNLGFPVLDNDGTVSVQSGTLNLISGDAGTTTGSYAISSGATLEIGGGTFQAPSITGAGTLDISSATVTVGPTATFSPNTVDVVGFGTLTMNGTASISNLLMSSGFRDGTGTLTVTGSTSFPGGGASFNGGTTTIAASALPVVFTNMGLNVSGATLNLDTSSTWASGTGVQFTNGSAVNINAVSAITANIGIGGSSDSVLNVGAAGSLTANPGSGLTTTLAGPQLHNHGSLTVQSGTLDTSSGGFTQTSGTTTVTSGTQLNGQVTLNGGTLTGDGTLGGSVDNAGGTLAPGSPVGTLTILGTYTQGPGGTLAQDIAGTTPGTQFDQLLVGGALTLGGTLAINSTSFTPSPSDTFKIISGAPSRSGTFASVTGANVGGLMYTPQYDPDGVTLTLGSAPVPTNITPPVITGTPAENQTLTCQNGTWTGNPTSFTYQWNLGGVPISGATGQTFVVPAADAGHTLTCRVVASNAAGSSSPVTSAPVTVASPPVPVDTTPPTITGTPLPGDPVTCKTGSWRNQPTSFTYQWKRGGKPIPGATAARYVVQILDEAQTLTCTVIASNGGGAGSPATSSGLLVAVKGTLGCPKPAGHIGGLALGRLSLGMTRATARHALKRFNVTHNGFDNFCLYAGWGIRVGYPSAKLLRSLGARLRGQVGGRVVIALTANPFYALHGVRPGVKLSSASHKLKLGKTFHVGLNDWYLVPAGRVTAVLKVRAGVVQEVGIADRRLTQGRAEQARFITSFG